MNEELQTNEEIQEEQTSDSVKKNVRYATTYAYQRPAIQTALFVLWRIQNKEYQTGSRLYYEELKEAIDCTKGAYREALTFLEGAGLVMNEVVVADKVPTSLVQRYGLLSHD